MVSPGATVRPQARLSCRYNRAMSECPCGSGSDEGQCCLRYIEGSAVPPTAEALMRSRYTAFVTGNVDYILATNHSDTRDEVSREDVEHWSRDSEWLGLTIRSVEDGGEADDEGVVSFVARYSLDGQLVNHRERGRFLREDGEWRFHSPLTAADDVPDLVPVTPRSEVGRNDPCPCGSGRKYKKCCGA